MSTNFNFNSSVCTSREQSERLLSLGLKKETADMIYVEVICTDGSREWEASPIIKGLTALDYDDSWLPAWSLHRMIEMVAHTQYPYYVISKELPIYDALCERIEWLIKEGYFNKEYLNGTTEN